MSGEHDADCKHGKYSIVVLGGARTMQRFLESEASEHTTGVCRDLILLEHHIGVVHDRIGRGRFRRPPCQMGAWVNVIDLATNTKLSASVRIPKWDVRAD